MPLRRQNIVMAGGGVCGTRSSIMRYWTGSCARYTPSAGILAPSSPVPTWWAHVNIYDMLTPFTVLIRPVAGSHDVASASTGPIKASLQGGGDTSPSQCFGEEGGIPANIAKCILGHTGLLQN